MRECPRCVFVVSGLGDFYANSSTCFPAVVCTLREEALQSPVSWSSLTVDMKLAVMCHC